MRDPDPSPGRERELRAARVAELARTNEAKHLAKAVGGGEHTPDQPASELADERTRRDARASRAEARDGRRPAAFGLSRGGRRERPRRRPYRPWAELLRRTFGFDVLACPRCDGRLRLLAMVTEPEGVARYLRVLGEPTEAPARRSSRGSIGGFTLRPPKVQLANRKDPSD